MTCYIMAYKEDNLLTAKTEDASINGSELLFQIENNRVTIAAFNDDKQTGRVSVPIGTIELFQSTKKTAKAFVALHAGPSVRMWIE